MQLAPRQVMTNLLTRRYQPDRAWQRRSFFYKFLLRCLCYPKTSYSYLQGLMSFPDLAQMIERQGLLCAKIHRPYLCSRFSPKQRAKALIDHYQWIKNTTNPHLKALLQTQQPIKLMAWTGKDGKLLEIECGPAKFDREGESMLRLYYDQQMLACVTFTFCYQQGLPVLFIGGLQGSNHQDNQQLIREATKACHGLFPKRLLIEFAGHLAIASGITQIRAVSDKTHIFSKARYRYSKQKFLHANYDEFWESLGASSEHGVYSFKVPLARRDLSEIPSKKRSEYRRRYELLDVLKQHTVDILSGIETTAVVVTT